MSYDTFITRKANKYNKTNKASKANKVNTEIKAYDAAKPKATTALEYNDTTGIHLKFYLKTCSDLQKTNKQSQQTNNANKACNANRIIKPTMNTMFQGRKLLRF